jgi:hypothetical protein
MKSLTILQLKKAMKQYDFILLRYRDNSLCGVNCKMLKFLIKKPHSDNSFTNYISFIPCNFNQYITNKIPF